MKEDDADSTIMISQAYRKHAEQIVTLLLATWLRTYPNDQFHVREEDVREKFGSVHAKVASIGDFLDSIRNMSDVTYLIAADASCVSGFLYATKAGSELYISALYVDIDHQRAGIGSSLLRHAMMVNHDINRAVIDVVSYNTQAIAFYRKHDFVMLGLSATPFGHFPNGIVVPEVRMIKSCACADTMATVSV